MKDLRVLFVDDEPDIVEQAEIFLERVDDRLDVVTAMSVEDGLEMLREGNFDVVVSDYKMPGKDGLQFLRKINREGFDVPFILFTGRAGREEAEKAQDLGAKHFLLKGKNPKQTYDILARYIRDSYSENANKSRERPIEKPSLKEGKEEVKIRVLFVDDEPDIVEQAEIFLERVDDRLDVVTAMSVEDGLEMLREGNFDVVVSDYKMPGKDGLQFLKIIRDEGKDLPFIIFTGKGGRREAARALRLGGDHFVLKGKDPKSQYKILAEKIIEKFEKWIVKKSLTF